jgi:hypothetical protein
MKILSFSLILSLFMLVGFQSHAQQDNKKAEKQTLKKSEDRTDGQVLTGKGDLSKEKVQLQKRDAKKQTKADNALTGKERPRLEPKQPMEKKGGDMSPKHEAKEQAKSKGHGYGKANAKEVKMVNQKKVVETKASIVNAEESVKKAYDSLKQKQIDMEKDLELGKITQEDYDRKEAQINKALIHMYDLKRKIAAGKEQIKE